MMSAGHEELDVRWKRRRGLSVCAVLALIGVLAMPACRTTTPIQVPSQAQVLQAAPAPRVGILADPCAQNPDTWQGNPDAWRTYDWGQRCHYWNDNAALPLPSLARVVFIGDSITESWREADPQLFSNDILNRGISGQTSEQMLVRFRWDVIELNPNVVHIMAGTNDVAGNTGPTSLAIFQGDLRAMVEQALLHEIRVVLASVPPAAQIPWRPEVGQAADTIFAMNAWLRRYAQCEHLVFVDYAAALDDGHGGMKPGLSNDGVHPASAGYAVMSPLAREAISRALSDPLASVSPQSLCGV